MALTPKLEIRQSQSLLLTPRLRQAISLLQMNNLELNEAVEQELRGNPLLEREDDRLADTEDDFAPTIDDIGQTPEETAAEEMLPDIDAAAEFDDFGSDSEGYEAFETADWADYNQSKTHRGDDDAFDYFEKKHPEIKLRINTNGHANFVYKKNVCEELKGLIDTISVSLNGATEEEYNELSKPSFKGAYDEVKKFIKASSDTGITTIATIVEGYKGRHLNIKACEEIAQNLGATLRVREWIKNGYE